MTEQWPQRRLTADEITRAFWPAIHEKGIRFRWDPALVAKLAKIHENDKGEWLRMMPQLITWTEIR